MSDPCYQFICACLGSTRERASAFLKDRSWSWEHLFQVANREFVLPTVVSRIRELGLDTLAPPEISDFLTAVEYLNRERNAAILAELQAVVGLLNEFDIEPVLLKGAAYLVCGVYSDPAQRYLMDIDLLIPASQLPLAVTILKENGFEPDKRDRFGRFRHHHPPLRRSEFASFELHHSLGMGPCTRLLPAHEVRKRSLAWELDCIPGLPPAHARLPCPEHLITHLILHSQIQHPYHERIWPPLRALYDLLLLRDHFGDPTLWVDVERRFRRARRRGLLVLHLLDAKQSLGVEFPVVLRHTLFTHLRRLRRNVLRNNPRLRYIDPLYMFLSILARRLRIFRNILRNPAEWIYVFSQLLEFPVYRRLLSDLVLGRGR